MGSASPAETSGRHRLQGRNPASRHAATLAKNRLFSRLGFLAGQVSRQKTPVLLTPTQASPSKEGSRAISAWYRASSFGKSSNILYYYQIGRLGADANRASISSREPMSSNYPE